MKRLIAVALLMSALVSNVHAWEFQLNPDRCPSIGFNIDETNVAGDRTESDLPTSFLTRTQSGPEKHYTHSFGADLRLPVNNGLTITLTAAHVDESWSYERQHSTFQDPGTTIYKESAELSGAHYGISARIYFNK